MNVLLAEAVGFGERAVSIDDVFLVFEERSLVHKDFESLFAVARSDYYFVEGVGEGGIFGGDFEEFLVVHDKDSTDAAGF